MKVKKQSSSQSENSTHVTAKKDREKALKALEFAKSIQGKSVFLPKGKSRDFEKLKKKIESQKKAKENILSPSAMNDNHDD
jgi:hypothetical protein